MSEETRITPGCIVRTTRALRSPRADRPILLANSVGTVLSIRGSYAGVVFEPGDLIGHTSVVKLVPLAALEFVEQVADLTHDWNMISAIQQEAFTLTLSGYAAALEYKPLTEKAKAERA